MGMKVAVTGASGFVGRHLVQCLNERRDEVVPLSRAAALVDGRPATVVGSYLDAEALARAFAGCDAVVHLAARAHVLKEVSSESADEFSRANRDSAHAVAKAAAAARVRRMVLVSSIGVNGSRTRGQAFRETDLPRPTEPYAVSKWEGEQAAASALLGNHTELVVLRPPLVYGPGCPGNFRTLMTLVRRLPLVPLGGFRKPRSLIHVGNLCDAIRLSAFHPGIGGRTFVLSDGEDVSVADVAHSLAEGYGKAAWRVVSVPETLCRFLASVARRRPALDKLAAELRVDPSGFQAATGWRPPNRARDALRATARAEASAAGPAESVSQ
jgi:UDP-4-keto-D-FucNAc 4-reductase